MRRRLILHETEVTRERFLLYRRSSILQDIYFLHRFRRFVSELMFFNLVCMLATIGNTAAVAGRYACINTRKFVMNNSASFQSSSKINRMLITRLIFIR